MSTKRTWTDEQLAEACIESMSLKEVAEYLGLVPSGGTTTRLREAIETLGLDVSHFPGKAWWRGKNRDAHNKWVLDEQTFRNGIPFNTNIKRRFLRLVEYKCTSCDLSEWLGKPLTLHIDHIDGDRANNLQENLRLLCPNCHSQTPTYARQKRFLKDDV